MESKIDQVWNQKSAKFGIKIPLTSRTHKNRPAPSWCGPYVFCPVPRPQDSGHSTSSASLHSAPSPTKGVRKAKRSFRKVQCTFRPDARSRYLNGTAEKAMPEPRLTEACRLRRLLASLNSGLRTQDFGLITHSPTHSLTQAMKLASEEPVLSACVWPCPQMVAKSTSAP